LSDSESEKIPNEKYKLSNSGTVTYHYSRERRLANAPSEIQNLYKEQKPLRFNLFGPLVADKPRRVLFFVIVILCIGIFLLSRLGFLDASYRLDGNTIDVSGTFFEDTTIVILKKTAANADAYTGAVDIAVFPITEETDSVFYHRIFFTLEKEEVYRFVVPFEDPQIGIILQNEKSFLNIVFNPQ